jgi:site-specific DNA-methyltransferase (adenine-specific)
MPKIICDDFLTTGQIPDNSIDLIVTSPPYNLDMAYSQYKDEVTYEDYLCWTFRWIGRASRVLKEDGRMCLNIPLDTNKGGMRPFYADVVHEAICDFQYQSTIVWNEQNISRRTAWGSWMSASAPYVIAPVEMIVVLYKSQWKKLARGASDITREEFLEWTNGVWTFPGESAKRIGHPAPFPLELPRRCIKLFSYVGDVVCDPFMGSGTTLVAARELDREAVGVDVSEEYCNLARRRLGLGLSDVGAAQTGDG